MKNPLVTVSIPTYNSQLYIQKCLKAIYAQSYKNIEINIIDGNSTDDTLRIAKVNNVEDVLRSKDALLEARYLGTKKAKGKYTLLLDSDQILEKDCIERAVGLCEEKGLDMLMLEEGVYQPYSFIERLFKEDRRLIHTVKDFSPLTGVMLPRFYRTELLLRAMGQIPLNVRREVGGQDHAIIYFEVWKLSKKVGLLSRSVNHIEPDSLRKIWKKFYRWGYTSVGARYGQYEEMLKKKEHFRTGLFQRGYLKASFASTLLLLLKGVPYKIGYFTAKLHKR
jgi:glycosyltransferase involved in cell wall biosynthesis